MAISPQRLTIYLYSAHRAIIFAIAQLSCKLYRCLCVWHSGKGLDVDSKRLVANWAFTLRNRLLQQRSLEIGKQ